MVNRLSDATGKGRPAPVQKASPPLLGTGGYNTPTGARPASQYIPGPAPAAPQPSSGGGGPVPGGGGGGGGGIAGLAAGAPVAAAPAAPAPVKDIDWFNQDSVYRGAAGRSLADLTGQLAQILAQRDQNYNALDVNRQDVGRQREQDLGNTGADFASRGLLGSGLYADYADDVSSDYARQNGALDLQGQNLGQQYGQRGSQVNLNGVDGQNGMGDLSALYGMLGSLGNQAGQNYNSAIGKAKADSAARSTSPLLQTSTW